MCLASAALRVPALEDRSSLLQDLAHRRYLEEAARSPARTAASPYGQRSSTEYEHSGFAVSEDYLGGRRGSRIRRRQEGKGKKTSLAGRHRRLGPKSEGPRGQCNRPRGDRTAARGREKGVPAPFPSVVGRWLQR